MKKMKIALLMASIIGASSFQLQAQEINIENYDMLSQVEKEQNFTNVIVKLEEGRTLEELQNYGIKFKKSETIPFEYHNIILENNGYDMVDELNRTGLFESVDLNIKLSRENTDTGIYYETNQASNAEVNPMVNSFNDPRYSNLDHFRDNRSFPYASSIERAINVKAEQNVKMRVGVIDTGTLVHSDILFDEAQNVVTGEEDKEQGAEDITFYDSGNSFCTSGHGLSVSYLISGLQNNNIGGAGIVDADLVMVRGLTTDCTATPSYDEGTIGDIAKGIYWLSGQTVGELEDISEPVNIINISLGSDTTCSAVLQSAINFATENGIIVVTSAGNNDQDSTNVSPANCENVINVGSHTTTTNKASFSNYGDNVDLTTLGVNIDTAKAGNVYTRDENSVGVEGTSYSAAIVSGVVGLIKEKYPSLQQDQAEYFLKKGVTPNTNCTEFDGCGAGVLNAYKSITIADQFYGFSPELNHFYEGKDNCEDTVYLEKMDSLLDVCNLYNVQITQSEALIPMEFQIVKRDEFETTWKEGTLEVVAKFTAEEGVRNVSYLLKENDSNFEYGIRACEVEGECYTVKDIDVNEVLKPAYCND
tara:strand:+ start:3565 stop:5334 length:1770 start_codon:yes stop_codon:yes gene_type:complete